MFKLIAGAALAAGTLGVAGCHTTSAETLCREYVQRRNEAVGFNKYSLVDFDKVNSTWARCLLRDNQTFTNLVVCVKFEDHQGFPAGACD